MSPEPSNTVSKQKLLSLKVRVPVQSNGAFDLECQRDISSQIDNKLSEVKAIFDLLEDLVAKDVSFDLSEVAC